MGKKENRPDKSRPFAKTENGPDKSRPWAKRKDYRR
jgi:hypothetical protein